MHEDPRTITRKPREVWLNNAVDAWRPRFEIIGYPLPAVVPVSVGWPLSRSIGENKDILAQTVSSRGVKVISPELPRYSCVFVSPLMGDTVEVLTVIGHELIHVVDDVRNGHTGPFREMALAFGFRAPLTELNPEPVLTEEMTRLALELGPYPHDALDMDRILGKVPTGDRRPVPAGGVPLDDRPLTTGPRKQTTRMLKVWCIQPSPAEVNGEIIIAPCGYTVRTTQRWLDVAVPHCPVHKLAMNHE